VLFWLAQQLPDAAFDATLGAIAGKWDQADPLSVPSVPE
jgi:hypothetical protein